MEDRQKAIEWYVFIFTFLLQAPLAFLFNDFFDIFSTEKLPFFLVAFVSILFAKALSNTNSKDFGPQNLLKILKLKTCPIKYKKVTFDQAVSEQKIDIRFEQKNLLDFFAALFFGILFSSVLVVSAAILKSFELDNFLYILMFVPFYLLIFKSNRLIRIRLVKEIVITLYILLQESSIFLRMIFVYALFFIFGLPIFILMFSDISFGISLATLLAFFELLFLLSILSAFVELLIYLNMKLGSKGALFASVIFIFGFFLRLDFLLFMVLLFAVEGFINSAKYSVSKSLAMTALVSLIFVIGVSFQNTVLLVLASAILLPFSFIYVWFKRHELDVLIA